MRMQRLEIQDATHLAERVGPEQQVAFRGEMLDERSTAHVVGRPLVSPASRDP